ncbi:MAG: YhjD/YihY/BrkB family envelope integrity protein [Streptosporangiaceae bacterium]
MLFLAVLGLGAGITTLLTFLPSFSHNATVVVAVADLLAALTNIGMYFLGFRVLTPKGVPSRKLLPGAIVGGVGWTLMQALGTYLVHHYLSHDSVYGIFATVLGLVGPGSTSASRSRCIPPKST